MSISILSCFENIKCYDNKQVGPLERPIILLLASTTSITSTILLLLVVLLVVLLASTIMC
jgi:hypothetical protein